MEKGKKLTRGSDKQKLPKGGQSKTSGTKVPGSNCKTTR